ncbi:UDP-N-acetylmuramoyl-tripeptide--D-alanyl-D-alanine ligase [Bacteroidales bacterium OttesenSCG-928-J19]|nr:UDP-N-acetylmuramoyl-tripeptide--D-alanyl-D-alanine ligase [Bacteroidales bacterium OttesenSCG-928-J19]
MNISDLYSLFREHPLVSTDSRNCPTGCLFFALKGDRFDGNDYVEQVLNRGAAYAVADRTDLPADKRIIQVNNVLETLQQLAHYHRQQMNAEVIALTGTNGKTTTKELLAACLTTQYKTLFTEGNLNNHIGVPLTLLRLTPEHELAVIEMGANHPGEIDELCRIADPDYGLITNVGKAHLEGFGSFEGVVKTKTELYNYLRHRGGTIFANLDNLILKDLVQTPNASYYGTNSEAFIHGNITGSSPTLSLTWFRGEEQNEITTHLVGGYNLENVLAAICVAAHFGVGSRNINRALTEYIPQNNRSQKKETEKNALIIDAYNANPTSMRAAVENFATLPHSPKLVILGEMKELGSYSHDEHQALVDYLTDCAFDRVMLVGENFTTIDNIPMEWQVFSNTDLLLSYLNEHSLTGYTILIKGSRGNQLEQTICKL